MPFKVVKFKKGWAVQDDKGHLYSNKPLTKQHAIKQQRALYSNYDLRGDGFFSDSLAFLRNQARRVAEKLKSVKVAPLVQSVAELTSKHVSRAYPPDALATLEKYKDGVVQSILVRREPIVDLLNKVMNVITFGKWGEIRGKLDYDKLFHLSMVVTVKMPTGQTGNIMIEKNSRIKITDQFHQNGAKMEYVTVPVPCCITLGQMMERAEQAYGPDYFVYDAFRANCQLFIKGILDANGLSTPQTDSFINQNVDSLIQHLPSYTSPFARTVTNIHAIADRIIRGGDSVESDIRELLQVAGLPSVTGGVIENLPSQQRKPGMQPNGQWWMPGQSYEELRRSWEAAGMPGCGPLNAFSLTNPDACVNIRQRMQEELHDKHYKNNSLYRTARADAKADSGAANPYLTGLALDQRYQTALHHIETGNLEDPNFLADRWKEGHIESAYAINKPRNMTITEPNGERIVYDDKGREVFNKDKHTSVKWLNSIDGRRRREHDFFLDELFKKKVQEGKIDERKLEADYKREVAARYGSNREIVTPANFELLDEHGQKRRVSKYQHRSDGGIDVQFSDGHWEDIPGSEWNCNQFKAYERYENYGACGDAGRARAAQQMEGNIRKERDKEWEGMSTGDKIANGLAVFGSVSQDYILPAVSALSNFIPGGQAVGAIADITSAAADLALGDQCRHFNECTDRKIQEEQQKALNHITKGEDVANRVLLDDNWATVAAQNRGLAKNVGDTLAAYGVGTDSGATGSGRQSFADQIRAFGFKSPADYLRTVRAAAKRAGYDPRALQFSDRPSKKLMIWDDDGKRVYFGAVGYGDFHLWSKKDKEMGLKKRKAYLARATKIAGDWKKSRFSPNSLAISILWT